MGNRLIFLYLLLLRWGDGEGWTIRATVVPVQARREQLQANPELQSRDVTTRPSFGLAEVVDAMLPGKASKLQAARDRTRNQHRWAG